MSWQDKLTEDQRRHLEEVSCKTEKTFRSMRRMQQDVDPGKECCAECKAIAVKLGIER